MTIDKFSSMPFFTNTYVITNDDQSIIIDPTMRLDYDMIKGKYNIVAVLLTHAHVDHIVGVNEFKCPIYIHDDDYNKLFDNNLNVTNIFGLIFHLNNDHEIIRFKNNETLKIGNFQIKTIHTPGHTSGSCCFLIDNVLFSGDTLFQMGQGRTDFPTGSVTSMNNSLKYLIEQLDKNIVVYPGHGEITTIEEEKNNPFYQMIKK